MNKAARMLIYAGAVVLPFTALAQPAAPVPGPDPQFVQNALAALQQQRNSALDQAAQAQAQLAMAQGQLASMKKELDDLKAASVPKAVPEKK
jgi:hypothetical protein